MFHMSGTEVGRVFMFEASIIVAMYVALREPV